MNVRDLLGGVFDRIDAAHRATPDPAHDNQPTSEEEGANPTVDQFDIGTWPWADTVTRIGGPADVVTAWTATTASIGIAAGASVRIQATDTDLDDLAYLLLAHGGIPLRALRTGALHLQHWQDMSAQVTRIVNCLTVDRIDRGSPVVDVIGPQQPPRRLVVTDTERATTVLDVDDHDRVRANLVAIGWLDRTSLMIRPPSN